MNEEQSVILSNENEMVLIVQVAIRCASHEYDEKLSS